MKLKNVYKIFALIALAIVLQGRSSGPGSAASLEVTGAPGSTGDMGTCANSGCHTAGSFDPSLALSVDPGDYVPTTVYVPGQTYFLNLEFTVDGQVGTGFQAVALDGNNAQAGSWSTIPSLAQVTNLSGRDYLEHLGPQTFNGGVSWDAEWTAPAAGTGDVTFYVAGLAINGNGNSGGDGVATQTITLTEMPPSSTTQIDRGFAAIDLFPNPVIDRTTVSITSEEPGDFQMNVLNTVGQVIQSEKINLQAGQNERNLNLSDLQSGLYFLQVVGDDKMSTQQLIKL